MAGSSTMAGSNHSERIGRDGVTKIALAALLFLRQNNWRQRLDGCDSRAQRAPAIRMITKAVAGAEHIANAEHGRALLRRRHMIVNVDASYSEHAIATFALRLRLHIA